MQKLLRMKKQILINIILISLIGCTNSRQKDAIESNVDQTVNNEVQSVENITPIVDDQKVTSTSDTLNIEAIDYRCNTFIILEVEEAIDNLTSQHIEKLLLTFDSSCSNHAEFGEYSNEVLFMVIDKDPELFLVEFQNLIERIDTATIFHEFASPIHDGIDVRNILNKIENTKINNSSKERIKEILKGII
jgi:hypothetical protein